MSTRREVARPSPEVVARLEPAMLSLAAAARTVRMSQQALLREIRAGRVRAHRPGRFWMVSTADLKALR